MTAPIGIANRAYHQLLFYLVFTLIVAILTLDGGVYLFVIRPLRTVSDTADRVSRGEKNVPPIFGKLLHVGRLRPRTSTGTTGVSRRSAEASSIRTKSFASSRRADTWRQ
jgi:hypothetical protein